MKIKLILLVHILLFVGGEKLFAQNQFEKYFINSTLRFDYQRSGNADTGIINYAHMKHEPFWGGSKKNLIDKFNYGMYRLMVYDSTTNELIYSRGYKTLFHEWQSTDEAKKVNKSFYEVVVMPFPKKSIRIKLQHRTLQHKFITDFEMVINPKNYFISKEKVTEYPTKKIIDNNIPEKSVDVVILPDGYTQAEMGKFREDAEKYAKKLLQWKPFLKNKKKFNFWIVEAPSLESGTDIPGDNIWKNTVLNSSFYTFDSERYLMTEDIKTVRDIASCVPYDQIYILVNTNKYGGGGVYNYYSLSSANNLLSEFVFAHEFGHGFASLADEYYTADVAYEGYYDLSVEPYLPNITTLVDFDSKWKDMLKKNTPIPTPTTEEYRNKVGVFEGGGYLAKGIYRPAYNCTMKSAVIDGFCPVCQRAIQAMIDFYTK